MVFLSPDFAKLRFRKTLRQDKNSYALNGPLYKLFFAVEENRSVAQIAAELDIRLADARQGLERLCNQGMIAPLADQGPHLPADTLALIQHHLSLAMSGRAEAASTMRQIVRQLSVDGRHIGLPQARTFLNQLCDRIQHAEARQRFRSQVMELILRPPADQPVRPAAGPTTSSSQPSAAGSIGRTRAIINAIIAARSRGNSNHVALIKNTFRRYGIEPDRYRANTRDDPKVVARLERMASKTGIPLPSPSAHAYGDKGYRSAAELRRILDAIIHKRHGNAPDLALNLYHQLRQKGIHPGNAGPDEVVDAGIVAELRRLAKDLGTDVDTVAVAPATRGHIKHILDHILRQRRGEGPNRAMALRTKLLLRGIDPEAFTKHTPDDPTVLGKVQEIAHRLGLDQ